jgi:CPA2 family monovalent cation:H+ antiporter-2
MEVNAHNSLTGIATVIFVALVCGIAMERFRQPALVGYILAGVLMGPSAFSIVEDRAQIDTLAELGVLLLLFIVGMELSLRSFRRIWRLTVMVTAFQIFGSVSTMLFLSMFFGFKIELAILLGFIIAVSSTAVAIKLLEDVGELRTRAGRVAVGVLIAQDLAVVPMMLGIAAMGGEEFDWYAVPKILLSIGFMIALIMLLSTGRKVRLPLMNFDSDFAELKPLIALAFCFSWAAVSGFLGLSPAYGAFIAGLIIGSSHERISMIEVTRPIQSILMMVFFLSIGLLIDLTYIWENLSLVLTLFVVVVVFKTILNVVVLGYLGQPWQQAFIAGVLISQIGEFSFLLSVIGVEAGVISRDESRIVISVTVMSLALSPIWVFTARRLRVLAQYGVTEAGQLMRLVYGPEAEIVAVTLDEAINEVQGSLRRIALFLRKHRVKYRSAKVALVEMWKKAKQVPSHIKSFFIKN